MARWRRRLVLATLAAALGATPALAHTTLPATLDVSEVSRGVYAVTFRVPAAEGPPAAIFPIFPEGCAPQEDPAETSTPVESLMRGTLTCGDAGLKGGSLEIGGLPMTIMDVVVRVTFADGTVVTKILRPDAPSFTIADGGARIDMLGYARMGVAHILGGVDHLLFVAGLLLIVTGVRRLLKAITAFTVAHSITLAAATLGVVRFLPMPVEAVVALSIVFIGVELLHHERGVDGLTYRQPWLVAFSFGLLHGFGFAGTLSQVGIPHGDIPMALLSFNAGVEAGQLAFIAAFLAFVSCWQPLAVPMPRWARALPAYGIGSFASYWFLQRCALMFGF